MKKKTITALLALGGLLSSVEAQVPTPEQLLPADTIAVLTIPSVRDARSEFERTGFAKLFSDPAMQPFINKFKQGFEEEIVSRFEEETGMELDELLNLAQGQITLAVTATGWDASFENPPSILALIDAQDQKETLAARIDEVKQKAIDSGETVRSETIRGVEFSVLPLDETVDAYLGLSDSLLVIGNNTESLEQILARQSGGSVAPLAENTNFNADYNSFMRDSVFYGWVNFETVAGMIQTAVATIPTDESVPVVPGAILEATGLLGLKTIAMNSRVVDEGTEGVIHFGVPQSERKGLFKLFDFEQKDASVPSSIPEDVVTFSRWRFDAQKAWATLEGMINEAAPQMAGVMQFMLGTIGKDQDPNFDFKTSFIGKLGDDIISYSKFANYDEAGSEIDLSEQMQSQVYLISSSDSTGLLNSVHILSSTVADAFGGFDEREVAGRTIYGINIMPDSGLKVEFTAINGYLVVATDSAIMDEVLRNDIGGARPLREKRGLAQAIEAVGGANNGLFSFQNDQAYVKYFVQILKDNPDLLSESFAGLPEEDFDPASVLDSLFDFELLPATDEVAKYFNYTVSSGHSDARGISIRTFSPNPPGL